MKRSVLAGKSEFDVVRNDDGWILLWEFSGSKFDLRWNGGEIPKSDSRYLQRGQRTLLGMASGACVFFEDSRWNICGQNNFLGSEMFLFQTHWVSQDPEPLATRGEGWNSWRIVSKFGIGIPRFGDTRQPKEDVGSPEPPQCRCQQTHHG